MHNSPTLQHAVESLEHGIEHFFEGSPTSRKFAFIHIDHAIELLLKEKISLRGKSVFKKDGTTYNLHECFTSLEREQINLHERPRLEELHEIRNIIQHRGLNPDENLTEYHIRFAFSFSEKFIDEQLELTIDEILSPRIIRVMRGQSITTGIEKVDEILWESEHYIEQNPLQSIINSWTALELFFTDVVAVGKRSKQYSLEIFIRTQLQNEAFEPDIIRKYEKLRKLRNRAVHGDYTVTKNDSQETNELVVQIIRGLKKNKVFITTLGVNIDDLIDRRIITKQDAEDYIHTCDNLEDDLKTKLDNSEIGEYYFMNPSTRNGETLSIRIAHKWDLSNGRPDFNFTEHWDVLEFLPVEEVYPDQTIMIKSLFTQKPSMLGGDWTISDDYECPICGRPNKCDEHKFVYRKWYTQTRDWIKSRSH
jgi:uncharacterized protein YutE (UPF0331/DUF86 family)